MPEPRVRVSWSGMTPTKTLSAEHREFNLCDIQPTPMLRGIVKLKFFGNPFGFLGKSGTEAGLCVLRFRKRGGCFLRLGNAHPRCLDRWSKINTCALVSDFNMPKPVKGCENHEQLLTVKCIIRAISAWSHR